MEESLQFALNMPLAKILADQRPENPAAIAKMAQKLEQQGVGAALMSEHPAPSAEWLRTDPAAHDSLDPLVALAMIAANSRTLRVFTNVLVLPYRNPFLTAKAAATLQILSGGRFILGVGVGYQKEEFEALGIPYKERGKLTDEAIETIRMAWAGGPVCMKGMHFDAPGNEPRPLPAPSPPIWVGGGSDRAVRRAALSGDGWAPYFSVPTNDPDVRKSAVVSFDHLSEKVEMLRELRAEQGLDGPFDLAVSPPFRPRDLSHSSAQRFAEEVHRLSKDGVNWIWTSLPCTDSEHYLEVVQWFGEEVIALTSANTYK